MNGRSRVMRWASTRHVIGTDIPLPVGPSLITSAAQAVAAIVTTVAMLGVLAWTALLATGSRYRTASSDWYISRRTQGGSGTSPPCSMRWTG